MDVRKAVKHRENYDSIVTYFKTLKTPGMDQMVLLIDTIEQMSPEIRALQGASGHIPHEIKGNAGRRESGPAGAACIHDPKGVQHRYAAQGEV